MYNNKGTKDAIWITWEKQRRNRELSKAFGIPLFEFGEIDSIENYVKKYSVGLIKTFKVIKETRPKYIFCQNPSIILSSFILILKSIIGFRVIVDSHNAGIFPLEGRNCVLNKLSRKIQRYADLTIVTTSYLKKHVEKNGGKGFVLQDKIPDIDIKRGKKLKGKKNILFICSYADDEPYDTVFQAAKKVEKDIIIYVTGNYQKKRIQPVNLPENVILTGYLSEKEYVTMLNSVDATIDLTNRQNCLVCGAYESIAAGKPMVLSRTQALMDYFNVGAVYVSHSAAIIAIGITEVINNNKELSAQITNLRRFIVEDWLEKKKELELILRGLL